MKKILLSLFLAAALMPAAAINWTSRQVADVVFRVNRYWQQHHAPETRSFWDPAVYHVGNMEVYNTFHDEHMLEYTRRWARHNNWSGATQTDPTKWCYKTYGEGKDFVLFADWQICFQTYLDLYAMACAGGDTLANRYMAERAMEVMHYEAYSAATDYWWWSDALFMAMPVMTKMYRLTGDERYLDKLYRNVLHSDSVMLDRETGLYFRDARYVYPAHKTARGMKDFWARGDGWVLAGLAKVLGDLPEGHAYKAFFADKFKRMAATVAKTQQKEVYWTRSILDPQQAPGPETSGTALFAYGLLWGVNNGYLSKKAYRKTIDRAWHYLTETALQADGSVGYVQPIGDRAIPGQTIDAKRQANFGVGAFLLAGCEYYRYLKKAKK